MSQLSPQLFDKIKHFAKFPQTGVSLRQMVMFGQTPSQGTLFGASQFLHEELPIRLAHRVKELEELPRNLSQMPSIIKVKHWYAQSFKDLIELPQPKISSLVKNHQQPLISRSSETLPHNIPNPSLPKKITNKPVSNSIHQSVPIGQRYYNKVDATECPPEIAEYTNKFVRTIEAIKRRHDPVVTTIAQGILEYKEHLNSPLIDTEVQAFLDRFYMSRIGIRMLIGQHVALYRGPRQKDYVGVICTKTNIHDVAQDAIANAKFICEEHYGLFKAPEVNVFCPGEIEFMYVPSHLSHMLFELLKNSMRAVVENYGTDYEDDYPPIKLIIAQGKEDITIKISDEGGGIPRSNIPLVWTYMYTTATAQLESEFSQSDFKAPMAGFGYGLPISRLYARYFGGDLKLISMEGYGTDVYLHLNRLSNSDEPLIYIPKEDPKYCSNATNINGSTAMLQIHKKNDEQLAIVAYA
ncbi:mitochondrial branched-chain alpha-ketoacid dehydrogenase kinase-domain-containing protein [Mycotypha africana]|uniref:mitochondrial branched-chain alpha-ketoacid dehydrogenase kinase-domain-containing protein n=1 Tax=Mycotypha africana TaxID=64632 RepID=UPI002301DEB8|nr:mitochondrial branched-chain alpha-ketoacid dehydrogenase kinase-domain-containing protein [Mycotypha africana]KAI8984283.1 mitochondrial branched-chain alpha-ketoacid dehydrogenase kinase-domain-containing protein [Mycotypha africana]